MTKGRQDARGAVRFAPVRFALPVILLIALALRLGWVLRQPAELDARLGDQSEYLQVGQNLVRYGELKFFDARFDQWVYAYRTPGYPWLIAACQADVRAVRMAQALLDTSTVLAVYLLSRRWLAKRGAVIAAGLVAVNPFLIYFTGLVLSETLFTALLAWGMYFLVRQRQPTLSAGIGLGLLGLSVLVRPSALGLSVLLAAASAWPFPVRRGLTAAAVVSAILLPWAWRNAHHPEVRSWIWTTTNSGITTYDGFHDNASGASDQAGFLAKFHDQIWRLDEVERDAFLNQQAHQWIQAHPGRSLELMGIKIARTWSPIPLSSEYGGNHLYVAVGLCFTLPLFVLTILGLWKGDVPRTAKVFLFLPAIYFTLVHALSVGSLRYRIPVEAPMSVLAGSGALVLLTRYGPSRR